MLGGKFGKATFEKATMLDRKIIYFDNAATSYPKPEVVYQAQDACLRTAGNPGRGAHRLALESARNIFESRCTIAQFLGVADAEDLVFTPGCTYAINTVLRGFPFSRSIGDSEVPLVIVSALEHNAVMRPLDRLEKSGVLKVHRLKYVPNKVVDLPELQRAIKDMKPALCAIQEGSNVTGEMTDIAQVWEVCSAAKVGMLIDAAQTAGLVSSSLSELIANGKSKDVPLFWCTAGHKGLMGPAGVGLLYVGNSKLVEPLVAGGTGSNSESLAMPENYPDRLESGTMPVHSIVGLAKAVEWLKEKKPNTLRDHEVDLTQRFLDWCSGQPFMKVFGDRRAKDGKSSAARRLSQGLPLVSFAVSGVASDRVADLLDQEFGIAVRSGLHCAMAAHQALGTLATGLTRASFGCFNTRDEIDCLCEALTAIHRKSNS
jgi:selenocysteine lyase/cysteine desulfurase